MKEVKSYIRVFMVANVIKALKKKRYHRVTAIDVSAITEPLWRDEEELSSTLGLHTHMIKIEIICTDQDVEDVINTIRETAYTGNKGDGIITVTTIDKCIGIRTGKINEEAVI